MVENEGKTWKNDPVEGPSPSDSFYCCWKDCPTGLVSDNQLKNHLLSHWSQEHSSDRFSCLVIGCDFQAEDGVALRRHILFHCYHAQLERRGMEQIERVKKKKNFGDNLLHCSHQSTKCNRIYYPGNPLVCAWDQCDARLDDPAEYFAHVVTHVSLLLSDDKTEEDTFACLWEGCTGSFKKKRYLKDHMTHHSGSKLYACPFCGSFLSDTTKLSDHILRKLSTQYSRLKCFYCQKTFSTERLLKGHMRRHVKKLKCLYCPMTCETPSDLRSHLAIRHKKDKDYICMLCSKGFSRLAMLRNHMTKHGDASNFPCPQCDKSYKWKSALSEHIALKHSDKDPNCYLCHICPQRFNKGNALSKHVKKQHDIKVPPGFAKFLYKKCEDGFFRLQTERYESPELAAELRDAHRLQETEEVISELILEDPDPPLIASTPIPVFSEQPNIPADLRNISAGNPTENILDNFGLPSGSGKQLLHRVTLRDQSGQEFQLENVTLLLNEKQNPHCG